MNDVNVTISVGYAIINTIAFIKNGDKLSLIMAIIWLIWLFVLNIINKDVKACIAGAIVIVSFIVYYLILK